MKKRILIIDDEEQILKLFSRILENVNCEIHTALSGIEAVEIFQTTVFDLILLDLKMPGMDGTKTLRAIREIDQNVPVYIVTAFQNEFRDYLKQMKKDGIPFEILNKPVEKTQLLFAVDSALKGPLLIGQMDIFRLYVTGQTAKTNESVEKFRKILNKNELSHHEFEIIDLLENPLAADDDKVFATPTMIRLSSNQEKRIVGDISDPEKVATLLGLL